MRIPSYSVAMLSVLIPVYNEEELIEQSALRIHDHLSRSQIDHEVIVTSNGSNDRTVEIGRRLESQYSWFRLKDLPEKSVGKAFVTGVREARGEFVVSMDADLSVELTFLDFAHELLKHAGMVVGSKTMGRQRRSFFRVFASQFYIFFTYLLFDLTISDYSMAAKAFRRESILPALDHLDSWTGYTFELALFLHGRNEKIIQVGVDCDDRRPSRFRLLHEGFYRYAHLYRCARERRRPGSWLNAQPGRSHN